MKTKNKKGGGGIYFMMVFALILATGYGIYSTSIQTEGLSYPGETSQRILSTIELANRVSLYIDIAIDQSIKNTIQSLKEDSAFLIERSADYVTPHPCGETVYPLLNKEKQEVECFPDYIETFKRNFERELTPKLHNFREISLSSTSFTTIIQERNNELEIYIYTSPISIPIYASFASYYDESIKRDMAKAMPSYTYVFQPETGYYQRGGLNAIRRNYPNDHPDSIVIHYTAGYRVDDAYNALASSRNSYHYIIEKDGKIFNFVDESMAAQHAGCAESNRRGFQCMDGYNQRSIAISFVNLGYIAKEECTIISNFNGVSNKCWDNYPNEQMNAAIQLVADIVERQAEKGNFMKINHQTILTHQEIDPVRKWDPGPLFDKQNFINRIIQELRLRGYEHET
jgi:N-acetyl-anhydromuramyl-L-alanine amidase AmpD